MPTGPFSIPRPLASCKQKIIIFVDKSANLTASAAEIQARINEIDPEVTQAHIASIRAEVVDQNRSATTPDDMLTVYTNSSKLTSDDVDRIVSICNSVFQDAFVEEAAPEVRSWIIEAE